MDERIFKGFWAWSWRWMSGSSRAFGLDVEGGRWTDLQGLWGLIFEERWTDLRGALGLKPWRTMNGSSRNLGAWALKNSWMDLQGALGLELWRTVERIFEELWGLSFEERWADLRGALGLELWFGRRSSRAVGAWSWRRIWRRTKRAFLILRDFLESLWSFKASRFWCNVNWWNQMNEMASYL